MSREPDAAAVELASRLGVHALVAHVTSIERLTPHLMAVTLTGPQLGQLAGAPGNDVMVSLARADGHQVRRRYSVRSVDAHGDQLTLWVTTGHSGIGASWVESLKLRDEVELIGPRGKIGLDPVADWHLFVGDASGFGAFYRMAESIEPPGQAIFVVELETMDDAVTPRLDADISPTAIFVERAGRAPGDPSGLLSALALLELPVGDGHAYLFGELATVRVVREALCDRGLDGGQIEMKAFWRAGVGNLDHGEPPKSD